MPFKKNRLLINEINVDSLMDILTCVVGIVLLVVVIAVIDARGVSVKMYMPMAKSPPENSMRKICICANGRVRALDISAALINFRKIEENLTYQNLPNYISDANRENIYDEYFNYKLDYSEWSKGRDKVRGLLLIVEEREGTQGDTVDDMELPKSKFISLLDKYDNNKVWIAFAVDKDSVQVFKKARDICTKKGFVTGWDPARIVFPLKVPFFDDGNRFRDDLPSPDFSKINTN